MPEINSSKKVPLKDKLLLAVIPPVAWVLIKFIGMTQRLEVRNLKNVEDIFNEKGNVIFAFWHNRFMMIPYLYRRLFGNKESVTLISQSRDGEFLVRGLKYFRPYLVRGSSSKGGSEALKKLVSEIREGKDCIITPDGPRGPRYEVQGGTASLAVLSKTPIIPVSYSSSRKKILNSWDRTIITLPFGKTVVIFGDPIYPYIDGKRIDMEELNHQIKNGIMEITGQSKNACEGSN
jgi:lysophospholipid acyltransferase (LPLAT)-like uncharacterized protein